MRTRSHLSSPEMNGNAFRLGSESGVLREALLGVPGRTWKTQKCHRVVECLEISKQFTDASLGPLETTWLTFL